MAASPLGGAFLCKSSANDGNFVWPSPKGQDEPLDLRTSLFAAFELLVEFERCIFSNLPICCVTGASCDEYNSGHNRVTYWCSALTIRITDTKVLISHGDTINMSINVNNLFDAHIADLKRDVNKKRAELNIAVVSKRRRVETILSDPRDVVSFQRDPKDRFMGCSRMQIIRKLLTEIDRRGFERSDNQERFHESFLRSCAPVIYKEEWEVHERAICAANGWDTVKKGILISTPRRFGKTFRYGANDLFKCVFWILWREMWLSVYSQYCNVLRRDDIDLWMRSRRIQVQLDHHSFWPSDHQTCLLLRAIVCSRVPLMLTVPHGEQVAKSWNACSSLCTPWDMLIVFVSTTKRTWDWIHYKEIVHWFVRFHQKSRYVCMHARTQQKHTHTRSLSLSPSTHEQESGQEDSYWTTKGNSNGLPLYHKC